MTIRSILTSVGIFSLSWFNGWPADSPPLPPLPPGEALPGVLVFHGRYQHRNTGRAIEQPSVLWVKQTPDGAITARAEAPFMNATEITWGDAQHRIVRSQMGSPASGNRPVYRAEFEFAPGRALFTRRGGRQDLDRQELKVPVGAWFDPNARPDAYCAANVLLRAFAVKQDEAKEFRVFDMDNAGEALADYTIRMQNVGPEPVEVPAGTFAANHYVLTQVTSADTWFKKRAGHVTDFWVLDNHVIVRIVRHREPYEVALLDYTVPAKLPGHLAAAVAKPAAPENPRLTNALAASAADLAAFFKEVDANYPFFELKGIRADWQQTKAHLSEQVKTCSSASEFLGLVTEAIACLRDAHMGLSNAQAPLPAWPKRYYAGVSFLPATSNRVVVMSVIDTLAGQLKPGAVVAQIDGREARSVLEEQAKANWSAENPYLVSSPQRARLFAYRFPMAGPRGQTHTMRFQAEGREQELRVAGTIEARGWPHTYNQPTNLTRADPTLGYTKLGSGAGYMYLRNVDTETAAGMGQALAAHPDAKGWIVDLRGNGGGGYDNALLDRLKTIPPPVAVLIDAGCISAGETLARDLAQLARARLLGSRTAGASSSKRQWTFPSGIASIMLSTRSRWRSDGQPIEFNGIQPDVETEAVPEEVAQGLNSEILRAQEWLANPRSSGAARRP
jgi:hypothetical protein